MQPHAVDRGMKANLIAIDWTSTEGDDALLRAQGMVPEKFRGPVSGLVPARSMNFPNINFLLLEDSKMVSVTDARVMGGLFI